jgi:hypothetical protein
MIGSQCGRPFYQPAFSGFPFDRPTFVNSRSVVHVLAIYCVIAFRESMLSNLETVA